NHVRYGNTVGLRTTVLGRPVRRVTRYRSRRRNVSPLEESRMAFTLETWKTAFAERLPQWRQRMQSLGVTSMYTFISAMALWPVAAVVQSGDRQMLLALGGVLAGVGANLLANRLQDWKDEADAARDIATNVTAEPALRTELDAVLTSLEAFQHARQALPASEHAWFDETLRNELTRQGNWERFSAHLTGSGAIAQGPGAVAAGERGVAVGGQVHGSLIVTGDANRSPA
ncbi:MAG TPA: hypothetical protein VI542_26150, partial [Candidatus Tectomicrobia bacterium]